MMAELKPVALETRAEAGARLFSPSAARNRAPIRDVFLKTMPARGTIVEIGSGAGEHVACLAAATPAAYWRPGDPDARSRASIAAWTAHLGLRNVAPPHAADVTEPGWHAPFVGADGALAINMIHIAPFAAAVGLIEGAGLLLRPGGRLFLYGPFARSGVHTAPSNAAFDASLKAADPRWGVRDLERDIAPLAQQAGFELIAVVEMPANNLSVIFERL
jgi:SAM-dependent methyltransferase